MFCMNCFVKVVPLCDTLLLAGLWKPGKSCQGTTPSYPQGFVLRRGASPWAEFRGPGTQCCLESCWMGVCVCWCWSLGVASSGCFPRGSGEWINLAPLCKGRLPCQHRVGWQREPLISGSGRGHPPVFWEVRLGGAGPAWRSMCQISIAGECFKMDLAKPVLVSYHIKLVTEAGNC